MLLWWLNLARKSGDPNQCDWARTAKQIERSAARIHESASYGSALTAL
jgi:hypothetical protein